MDSALPTNLPITGEMLRLISEVDRYRGGGCDVRQMTI